MSEEFVRSVNKMNQQMRLALGYVELFGLRNEERVNGLKPRSRCPLRHSFNADWAHRKPTVDDRTSGSA